MRDGFADSPYLHSPRKGRRDRTWGSDPGEGGPEKLGVAVPGEVASGPLCGRQWGPVRWFPTASVAPRRRMPESETAERWRFHWPQRSGERPASRGHRPVGWTAPWTWPGGAGQRLWARPGPRPRSGSWLRRGAAGRGCPEQAKSGRHGRTVQLPGDGCLPPVICHCRPGPEEIPFPAQQLAVVVLNLPAGPEVGLPRSCRAFRWQGRALLPAGASAAGGWGPGCREG